MRAKRYLLASTALAPFGLSLIPWVYASLSFFYFLAFPLCALIGLLWCGLFHRVYTGSALSERKTLRWLAPLAAFAFIVPIYFLLGALGVPLDRWEGYTPP